MPGPSSRRPTPIAMVSPPATTSSNSIARRFDALKKQSRRALVCYVTAGHPDVDRSLQTLQALQAGGADIIELGVPFSDPIADGPIIQASSQRALQLSSNGQISRFRWFSSATSIQSWRLGPTRSLVPQMRVRMEYSSLTFPLALIQREKRGLAAARSPLSGSSHPRRQSKEWRRSHSTAADSFILSAGSALPEFRRLRRPRFPTRFVACVQPRLFPFASASESRRQPRREASVIWQMAS